jgi:arylsulfatase A-like enzyme
MILKHTLIAFLLAPLATLHAADTPKPSSKPNILFILADDLGWTDGGCFGSKFYETPNIDRLATQGMRFTNNYSACTVCSPSRVPFIVSWKGVTKAGLIDKEHLVSTGLDIIPTLCDFAGIPLPTELKGRSVRALAEGRTPASWRETIVTENGGSRMLRSARYKYVVYATGKRNEMLTDMKEDPGEMKNLALDPAFASVLTEHRRLLKEWYPANGEVLDAKYNIKGN